MHNHLMTIKHVWQTVDDPFLSGAHVGLSMYMYSMYEKDTKLFGIKQLSFFLWQKKIYFLYLSLKTHQTMFIYLFSETTRFFEVKALVTNNFLLCITCSSFLVASF